MAFPIQTFKTKLDGQGNAILTGVPRPSGTPVLTDEQAYGMRLCGYCSSPDCTLWCSACDVKDIGKIRTFYCGRECQLKHRSEHKVNCNARLHLSRAASIFFELFVAFEKATQCIATPKVAEKDGIVTIEREGTDVRPWTGGSMFLQFPEETLPDGVSAELMTTILLDQTADEVFTTAKPFLYRFIQPFCKSMEVAIASVKNKAKVLYCYRTPSMMGEPGPVTHSVLKLHAGDSEVYALDITGAQFGWTSILYDWETYARHRIDETSLQIGDHPSLGHDAFFLDAMFPLNTVEGAQLVLRRVVMGRCAAQIQGLLDEYFDMMGSDGTRAVKILIKKKDTASFAAAKAKFLKRALDIPREHVEGLKDVGRMYMSKEFEARVALSIDEAAKYKDVWFDNGDARVKARNEAALKLLWQLRMKSQNKS